MTKLYDGSYQDIAKRLRDDDLITPNLLNTAADMIENYGKALDEIFNLVNERLFNHTDDEFLLDDIWKISKHR